MKGVDTNILIYAFNTGSPFHGKASAVMKEICSAPGEWMIADQVLWEYYRVLRNAKLLPHPCSAEEAANQIRFIREELGVACCAYDTKLYSEVIAILGKPKFAAQRTHDVVLAVTLRHHGVTEFYTSNTKNFSDLGFKRVINPIH